MSLKKAKPVAEFICGFCRKGFMRENSLHVHMCSTKQRHLDKDEKHVRLAFRIWTRFYELSMNSHNKTWDEFIRNQFYNDFIRVGRYIADINAVNTPQFIDFLIRSGLPVTKWTSASVYETYIRQLTKKETPDVAVERCISLMQQWAGSTGEHWTDFFRKVSPVQATMWIKSGRLSPWVLYTSTSFPSLFERMSPEQIEMVRTYIDPEFWSIMMERNREEVDELRVILEKAGV